jgi:hypothetical protein
MMTGVRIKPGAARRLGMRLPRSHRPRAALPSRRRLTDEQFEALKARCLAAFAQYDRRRRTMQPPEFRRPTSRFDTP